MDGHVYRSSGGNGGGGGLRRSRGMAGMPSGAPDFRPDERSDDDGCKPPNLLSLVRAVEAEVIPRLLSAHRAHSTPTSLPTLTDVETLANLAIESDTAGALAQIDSMMAEGVGMDAIYLNLLGATARMLGELWEQDKIGFVDVTMGLCTLHQVLFRLAPARTEHSDSPGTRRVLFAPVPGEDHVFGALIVARFFNRTGWRTWTETSISEVDLVDLIRVERFHLIGLSIACDVHHGALARTVEKIRMLPNAPRIMIGGHACDIDATLPERVGADASSSDPASAVQIAEQLVAAGQAHG